MKTIFLIVVAVFLVGFGEALRCYQCQAGENCREGECQGAYCSKTAGTVGSVKTVIKGCANTGGDSCSKTSIGGGSAVGSSCTCDSDWCNSATNSNVAISMLALTVAAAFGLRKVLA